MRKTIFVLSCLCLGLMSVLGFKIWRQLQVEVLDLKPPTLTFRAARQMFPFSVIPGGLMEARELADSIGKDPVVREHYRDLQPDRMWFMRMKKPMLAYVSYRKTNGVHWTTHPVTIPPNELVLTDGKNLVRARCGNRIEVKKPEPLPGKVTERELPPPDIALDTALPPLVSITVIPPSPSSLQSAAAERVQHPGHTSTPPTTWCCTEVQHALPSVPEPGSFFLVCAGGLGMIAVFGRKLL